MNPQTKPALRFYIPEEWREGPNYVSNPYYYFKALLSHEECDRIVEWGKTSVLRDATVMSGEVQGSNNAVRKTDIAWMPVENFEWLYDRIFSSACKTNFWDFDIRGFAEPIQFGIYDGTQEDAYYRSHQDIGPVHNQRKISFSIMLTGQDEYSGGDFWLDYQGIIDRSYLTKGSAIMFPSFLRHEVKNVTKGKRISLVVWVSGPKLR
jgi:PKHD-type hydroxylase